MRIFIYPILALSLVGCANNEKIVEPAPKQNETLSAVEDPAAASSKDCHVLESDNWRVRLETSENMGDLLLRVDGDVTFPSPGYSTSWERGPMDRRFPPSFRLNLITKAPKPGTMNVQMLTKETVSYSMPSPVSEYRSVMLFCNGQLLAEVTGVKVDR